MKKFTSILVVAAMLAAMMVTMIPTASAAWDGVSVSAALVGSGTEYDPYLITSENDLAFVAKQVNDAVTTYAGEYFKLTVDLDLGGHTWTPIGVAKPNYFYGNFDGDGHTITGLTVKTDPDNSDALYGGLFGRCYDGVIKNINVDGANIVSSKYAGVIAGHLSATKDTGSCSVINCHVTNSEVRGLQIGGVVGRASQSGVAKGTLKIIGCSANTVTLGSVTVDEYPTVDNGNHFVGGIVGGAGATLVSGCTVTNMVANIYGTSFAPVGGIIGVVGADKVSTDINNCSVVGATITASADCHPEKTAIGGLFGKTGHVKASAGDTNTESNIFNCFVSDVSITNATTSIRNGVVIGWLEDTIYFNDVYYVPVSGLESYGEDVYLSDYPFMTINALSDLDLDKLNKGNSTAVWTANIITGYPTVDYEAAATNVPNFVDYYVENAPETSETEPVDTPEVTDDVTTDAPEQTDEPTDVTELTDAPIDVTDTPTEPTEITDAPTSGTEEKGCGGMIAGSAIVIALLGTAVVFKKRK